MAVSDADSETRRTVLAHPPPQLSEPYSMAIDDPRSPGGRRILMGSRAASVPNEMSGDYILIQYDGHVSSTGWTRTVPIGTELPVGWAG